MDFNGIKSVIRRASKDTFIGASKMLEDAIFELDRTDLIEIITEIGIIPEDIGHDSTEEKVYTKASDILFAKALQEMGLQVQVLRERSDSADIYAKSVYHSYSLVGDAKAFRLSRTAKNAKDFKVDAMRKWRGTNDFSVLTCPFFQYPKSQSQVYNEALNGNVCLFSWEYLYVMLQCNKKETENVSFRDIWDQSAIIAENTTLADSKKCFLKEQNNNIQSILQINPTDFDSYFTLIKKKVVDRGLHEIDFYTHEIERIRRLDRKTAISQLLTALKIESKIATIKKTIEQMEMENDDE